MVKAINKKDLFNEVEEIKKRDRDLVLMVKTPVNKEVIIVPNDDIERKIKYIDEAYNYELKKKLGRKGVKIIGIFNLEDWIEKVHLYGVEGVGFNELEIIERERENQ